MGFSVLRPSEVWARDALLAIFRPFRPPFAFSDPDLRPPISLPLPCRSSRAAAKGESGPNQFQFDGKPH